jgi:hypothetical protein
MEPGDQLVRQKFNSIINICSTIIKDNLKYDGNVNDKFNDKFGKLGIELFAKRDEYRKNLIDTMNNSYMPGTINGKQRSIGAGRHTRRSINKRRKRSTKLNHKSRRR